VHRSRCAYNSSRNQVELPPPPELMRKLFQRRNVALLSHRTIEEAARAIDIVPNTLLRWMKEPEFDIAYRAAKRAAFAQSIARLHYLSSAAVRRWVKSCWIRPRPSDQSKGCG